MRVSRDWDSIVNTNDFMGGAPSMNGERICGELLVTTRCMSRTYESPAIHGYACY